MNEVILIGWIANEPIFKENSNGQNLLVFNLALKRHWVTKDGEKKDETQYHKIAAWGKLSEKIRKVAIKGEKVYVRGYLHNRKVQIEGESKPRVITEIITNDLISLEGKKLGYGGDCDISEE